MEAAAFYLKGTGLTYHEIAQELNRDDRTIWTVYNRALKKKPNKASGRSTVSLPLKVFVDRRLSFMESAVSYMKEKLSLTYHEIAQELNRDDRTIWTVYSRASKKLSKRGGKR